MKGYAVFEIPTKEARMFANKKKERVSEVYPVYDNDLKSVLESFQQGGFYDETISHYEVQAVK